MARQWYRMTKLRPYLKSEGVTRHVVLIGRFAFKVPRLNYGWRCFLYGLLANHQELHLGRAMSDPRLCPVLWSFPGGFLSVMARAEPLTDEQWRAFDVESFGFIKLGQHDRDSCVESRVLPVEFKRCSFGMLDGAVVAVDYGT